MGCIRVSVKNLYWSNSKFLIVNIDKQISSKEISNSNQVDLEEYKKKILLEIEEQKIMEIEKVGINCNAQYINCFGIESKRN